MDTEEDLKIQKAIRAGTPETDEGPYYHEAWWESYKGSIKGKLGGAVIGALIGAVLGGITALFMISSIGPAAAAMLVGGFATAGMFYGERELSEVGRVTGAVAAAQGKAEERMKSFETGKFAEMKQEIGELKSMLGGKQPAVAAQAAEKSSVSQAVTDSATPPHRTSHSDEQSLSPNRRLVFWKIAAIGLAVGVSAGALVAYTGMANEILSLLGHGAKPLAGSAYAASMTTLGLFGASFGINRDIFRQVLDKTDLWFKGIFQKAKGVDHSPVVVPKLDIPSVRKIDKPLEIEPENKISSPIVTLMCDTQDASPSTEHRGRLERSRMAAALNTVDPTTAMTPLAPEFLS